MIVVILTTSSHKSPSPFFCHLDSFTQFMNIYINLDFLISLVKLFYSCRRSWEKGLFSALALSEVEQRKGWKEKERWIHNGNLREYTPERGRKREQGLGEMIRRDEGREILYRPSSLFFSHLFFRKEIDFCLSQALILPQ